MAQYDNTNRGQVWKNDKKLTDNHPDYKGSINIDGREYWLSGWAKKQGAHENAPLVSFSVQPKVAPEVAGIPNQNYQPQRPTNPNQPQSGNYTQSPQPQQNQPVEQQPQNQQVHNGHNTNYNNQPKQPAPPVGGFDDFDDDIPF